MRPVEVKKGIHHVGVVDWNSRDFHGYSLSPYGTTYNAFLIEDEKNTLIDTVHGAFTNEFFCKIAHVMDFEKIDHIVCNHLEPDHSGALVAAVERIKPEKIFVSPMGKRSLETIYETEGWPIEIVEPGSTLNIGKRNLHFVETRMLHWPDNMFTYVEEDKMLISSDAFGQNFATSKVFADEVDRARLMHCAKEYYANIVLPYSPIVLKVLDKFATLGFEVDMLAPDHGLIWRGDDVGFILNEYRRYAEQKPQPKAVVVYDTMWKSTEMMADAICQGLTDEGIEVDRMWLKVNHHSAVMTKVLDAGALVVGSPTHNNGILPNMAGLLQYIKGLKPQNKVGGAFGSFGWSGECVKALTGWLQDMKIDVTEMPEAKEPGIKIKNTPNHEELKQCVAYGQAIGQALKAKIAEFE